MTKLITPALKGQITKAIKKHAAGNPSLSLGIKMMAATSVLKHYMPRQQAKHAARKILGVR